MSSNLLIANFIFITRQINIIAGTSIFIFGIIGNILSIIVFVSLHTFRENSCSFYLSIMSFVNIGQLLTGLLTRITINMSGIDWTQFSLVYCKIRMYFLVVCTNISMICMCLATIDQYCATCHRRQWQRWSNLRYAHYLTTIAIVFSLLTSIPCLIYYTHNVTPSTGKILCGTTNDFFIQLNIYFYRLILTNILPLLVTLVFGLLTLRNIKDISYRTVPIVRRELDKQLTGMILVQDLFTFFIILPIMTLGFISLNPNITRDPLADAQFQFANVIAVMFYYLYFTVSIRNFKNLLRKLYTDLFRDHFIYIYVFLNVFVVN